MPSLLRVAVRGKPGSSIPNEPREPSGVQVLLLKGPGYPFPSRIPHVVQGYRGDGLRLFHGPTVLDFFHPPVVTRKLFS